MRKEKGIIEKPHTLLLLFGLLLLLSLAVIAGCGGGGGGDGGGAPLGGGGGNTPPASGSLDTSFGTNGKTTTNIDAGNDGGINALAIQADGKIVVAGYVWNGSNDDFALVRYNPDGTLDTNFGTGGKVITPIGSGNDQAFAIAIQSDGKIVAAGYSQVSGADFDFALSRYNSDGSLDTGFGSGGKATRSFGTGYDVAYAVAVTGSGAIVAAGSYYSVADGISQFVLAIFNSDGSYSTGLGGLFTGTSDNVYRAVAIDANGKIVAAGYALNSSSGYADFILSRYNANLSGGDLGVITDFSGFDDAAYALALQPDGKIVVAGYTTTSSGDLAFALARYNTNGTLDTNFGTGGKVVTDFGIANEEAFGLSIQADGKIVAAGYSGSTTSITMDFALARYNADGSLDSSFGSNGKVTTDFNSGNEQIKAIAIDAAGKIIVGGYTTITSGSSTSSNFALARYVP